MANLDPNKIPLPARIINNNAGNAFYNTRKPLSSMDHQAFQRHIKRLEAYILSLRLQIENYEKGMKTLREVGERLKKCRSEVDSLTNMYFEARDQLVKLSKRESEIYSYTIEHPAMTSKEVATVFNLSYHTIKYHLSNIYKKIGIRGKIEL